MEEARAGRLTVGLRTPRDTVQKLRKSLHEKAKAEPGYRFYSLWDKVCRDDVIEHAYALCRSHGGAPGVDGMTFEAIEEQGRERWLGNLQDELRSKTYAPQPLLRVWIPKGNGGERPLGIPTIRDRVVQTAVRLVVEPIFEADLLPEQYAYREGLDAKMAIRRVFFHLTDHGRTEVVDGDLRDYFNTIPHGAMMKCVARRVVDKTVLSVIKGWMRAPVIERTRHGQRRTAEAKGARRGTPQGGVISPLLANLYFRRLLLAWRRFGYQAELDGSIVNYADDFVICCRPGRGQEARAAFSGLVGRVGLTLNDDKTRLVDAEADRFDFLGYTIGRRYGKDGRSYIGTCPSRKAVSRLIRKVRHETSRRWLSKSAESRVRELNRLLRGWGAYFNQGPVLREYAFINRYVGWRLRRWLVRKHKQRGSGYRRYPDELLYKRLGLFMLPTRRADPPRAKS
jgi:group II intron reverse transcriptase/maturase